MQCIDPGDRRRLLALATLAALFLSPSLFSSRVLLPLDLLPQYLPWAAMTERISVNNPIISDHLEESLSYHAFFRRSILTGELPFWNPYSAMGTPMAGTPASSLFSPFRWLLFWLPVPLFFEIRGLLILVLAGWGVYLFLRQHRILPDAALAGALAYQFGGYTVYTLGHPSGDNSAYFGWSFLCAEIYLKEGNRRAALALIVILGSGYLSGQIQVALFQHLVLTLYALLRGSGRLRGFLMVSLLGIAAASISLYPFARHLMREVEPGNAGAVREAVFLSPSEWLHFLIPNYQGNQGAMFLPAPRSPGGFLFIGALPALLALFSLRRLRDVRLALFGAVLISLLLLWGTPPLAALLALVPIFDFANYLHMAQPLLGLVCFLAAFGLDDLSRISRARLGLFFSALLTLNGFFWGFGFNTSAAPEILKRLPPAMEEIAARPLERVLFLGIVLPPNLSIYYETLDVRGYQAIQMDRYRQFMQKWPLGADGAHFFLSEKIHQQGIEAARRAGCSLIFSGAKLDFPGLEPIVDSFPYLYEIRGAARARLENKVKQVSTGEQALGLLFSAGADSPAFLEASEPLPTSSAGGSVIWEVSRPNDVVLEVQAEAPGWLVLRDAYHPNWQAFVDGSPSRIYPADYLFRAVRVPAGVHQVRFSYQPRWIALGALFSMLSLGISLLLFGGVGRARTASQNQS